jgi:hypothetical protein
VPCDTGGLQACYFWRTHGMSPGEKDHQDDLLVWEVYWQAQRVGFETVYRLRRLDLLSTYAADWLLKCLVTLQDALWQQQREKQTQQ